GTQGFIDKVSTAKVKDWEAAFVRFLRSERPGVLDAIEEKKALDDNLFERLKAAISTFNHQFGVEGYNDVPDPAPAPGSDLPTRPPGPTSPPGGEEKKPRAPRKPKAK